MRQDLVDCPTGQFTQQAMSMPNDKTPLCVEGIVSHLRKYAYLLSCQQLNEKIETTLVVNMTLQSGAG